MSYGSAGGARAVEPHERHEAEVGTLVDQLTAWGTVLKGIRTGPP